MSGSERLPRTAALIAEGIEAGLHPGAQVAVLRGGETVADAAWGEARAGVAMTPGSVLPWMSSGKPLLAVAFAQLWERGLLQPDDAIAQHLPEFARHGKEHIRIRHLLTHTAGLRLVEARWRMAPWDEIIAAICEARPDAGWAAGQRAGYHAASSWYLLGELVRRADGRPCDQYVREAILDPLGLVHSHLAVPPEWYSAHASDMGAMHDTTGEQGEPWPTETADGAAFLRPGASARGPARELARFYEAMRRGGELGGVRILQPQTVEALTARHRVGVFDVTFQHVIDFGLGFIVNSARYGAETVPYGYGRYASPRTFGHSGFQSSAAFCDPDAGLCAAVIFNGAPGEAPHQKRMRRVLDALYRDLGLAEGPNFAQFAQYRFVEAPVDDGQNSGGPSAESR